MKFLQREDVVYAVVNGIKNESVNEISLYTDPKFNLVQKEYRITDCDPSLTLHMCAQDTFLKGLKELYREFLIGYVQHKAFKHFANSVSANALK